MATPVPTETPTAPGNRFDRYFEISARGSTLGREIRGGLATFFTMAYIVVLNPLILGSAADITKSTLDQGQLAAATALVAGVLTILMGVVGRFPLALAAGLGINAIVAFEIAPKMTWADAMGLVVIEGLIILVLVLTGLRTAVFHAVPTALKTAFAAGIGLFLVIIGLVDAGIVRRVPDQAGTTVPVGLGVAGKLVGWPTVVFFLALALTLVLLVRRVRGAILIGILAGAVIAVIVEAIAHVGPSFIAPGQVNPAGWSLNVPRMPEQVVATPDLGLIGQFNVLGSWRTAGWLVALLFVFTLLLADFFKSTRVTVWLRSNAVPAGPSRHPRPTLRGAGRTRDRHDGRSVGGVIKAGGPGSGLLGLSWAEGDGMANHPGAGGSRRRLVAGVSRPKGVLSGAGAGI